MRRNRFDRLANFGGFKRIDRRAFWHKSPSDTFVSEDVSERRFSLNSVVSVLSDSSELSVAISSSTADDFRTFRRFVGGSVDVSESEFESVIQSRMLLCSEFSDRSLTYELARVLPEHPLSSVGFSPFKSGRYSDWVESSDSKSFS